MSTAQDATRREVIAQYGVIGEPPEPDLEGLVRLAATISGVPTAVINIIDDRQQHQIATVGIAASTCSRDDSMCAVVFENAQRVIVSDARRDERFAQNPFVTGDIARIRFYASSPLVTPGGVPIGTLCVFDDDPGALTAEQGAALDVLARQVVDVLELRRLARELRRSNEALEGFARQVSHDLRNPLTAISGFLELAVDAPELAGAPAASRAIERAEAAAHRMSNMLDDLLAFARVGGVPPTPVRVDVADLLEEIQDDLHAALSDSGAHIAVIADSDLEGDRTMLRVLVENLVANAVKFAAATGTRPHVEVRAERSAAGIRLVVDDNGPGVPVAERERVFGLMERGENVVAPGLGLGLATCRRIVEAHGGQIGISDAPLGGARVWVALPGSGRFEPAPV
ncbi:GAF domain-containing sensor histidine kinase [Microbacterium invictum]|uniref:Sensor-like histidine kinase SenX3 n=1 Tax=Microbacterium invictum TaxID=515415 RepID=A0ABZ0V9E6_9MICO|nr:GAF domain-containing sensor histidine kinase [Microbacterium invictum]WQB69422.1 GAF domain-containing sensor histidine kinase [Microbacterium invictum]